MNHPDSRLPIDGQTPAAHGLETAVVLCHQGDQETENCGSLVRLLKTAQLRVDVIGSAAALVGRVPADLLVLDLPAAEVPAGIKALLALPKFNRPNTAVVLSDAAEPAIDALRLAWPDTLVRTLPRPLHLHGLLRLIRTSQPPSMVLTA